MITGDAIREIEKATADIQTIEVSPSLRYSVEHTLARLDDCTKLKWMTQSKLNGETYQMVPIDLLYEVAELLSKALLGETK